MTRSDTIKALHANAKWQTHVTFNPAYTDQERARELRRLRKEARALEALIRKNESEGVICQS